MIKGHLIAALDYKKDKATKHERYTYRRGDTWYLVQTGPGYSNTTRITEFDNEGEAALLKLEDKTQTRNTDGI